MIELMPVSVLKRDLNFYNKVSEETMSNALTSLSAGIIALYDSNVEVKNTLMDEMKQYIDDIYKQNMFNNMIGSQYIKLNSETFEAVQVESVIRQKEATNSTKETLIKIKPSFLQDTEDETSNNNDDSSDDETTDNNDKDTKTEDETSKSNDDSSDDEKTDNNDKDTDNKKSDIDDGNLKEEASDSNDDKKSNNDDDIQLPTDNDLDSLGSIEPPEEEESDADFSKDEGNGSTVREKEGSVPSKSTKSALSGFTPKKTKKTQKKKEVSKNSKESYRYNTSTWNQYNNSKNAGEPWLNSNNDDKDEEKF